MDSQFTLHVVHDSEDDLTDGTLRDSPTIRLYHPSQSGHSTVDFSQAPQEEVIEHSEESRSAEDQESVGLGDLHRELLLFEGPRRTLEETQNEQREIIRSLRRELSMVKEDCEGLRRQLDFLSQNTSRSSDDSKTMTKKSMACKKLSRIKNGFEPFPLYPPNTLCHWTRGM
jgi:hypothetical protein